MHVADLDDRNRDHFAFPGGDVLVRSRLQAFEGESAGAAFCLKWTLEGEETYAFGDRDVRLRPGDVLLSPVGAARAVRLRARRPVEGRCLFLDGARLAGGIADDVAATGQPLLFPRAGDPVAAVLTALDRDAHAVPTASVVAVLLASLTARAESRAALAVRRPGRLESVHQRLLRVRAHIHGHFDQPLPLADLAARACMSPFHFARHFRAAFGLPPHAYVLALRLDTARVLLARGDTTVGEVAARVGMPDLQGFSRAFRRAHGVAPTAVMPTPDRARFA